MTERGICKERHSEVEQCRGKERRTEGDTETDAGGHSQVKRAAERETE